MVLHLGMTGAFRFDVEDPYVRAKLWLDDGRTLVPGRAAFRPPGCGRDG